MTAALRVIEKDGMDKAKALEAALGQIERAFGKGSVMKLGQRENAIEIETVSTGSLGLDIGLGIGGLPRGRVVEIYGPESSGKTTMALHVVAEAQKAGGTCAFVDAEHALDPVYARKLGVDVDELLISQPDAGEQALEIADTLVRSGAIDVLVVDSVAALVPRAELEGEMGDSHVGLQARLMSQALRKLTGSISKSRCMVIFINQIRLKIGVMFGSPETTSGGNALKFYASVRLDIRRIGAIKDRDEVVGNQTRVKVVKNKLAPPFRVVEFDIMYGKGVSKTGELLDLGVNAGIVEKSGAWFSCDGQRIGQGRENAKNFLTANPDMAASIERRIRENAGLVAEAMLVGDDAHGTDGDGPQDEAPAAEWRRDWLRDRWTAAGGAAKNADFRGVEARSGGRAFSCFGRLTGRVPWPRPTISDARSWTISRRGIMPWSRPRRWCRATTRPCCSPTPAWCSSRTCSPVRNTGTIGGR